MAYIVKYIKEFTDHDKIKAACAKDVALGYKVKVFASPKKQCDISMDNVTFEYVDKPMEKAVMAAKELCAEKCQLYLKRAIYSVDPREYDFAEKIKELDYQEAQELCVNGFNGIKYYIFDLAKRNSVRVEVLSLHDDEPTVIKEVSGVGEKMIKSMSKDTDINVVTLTEVPDVKGLVYNIFKVLSDEDIYVDSVLIPAASRRMQDISFCIKGGDKEAVEQLLLTHKKQFGFSDVIINEDVGKISVMGAGFHTQKGVAAKLLEILYENDINIITIFTSEVKISMVVDKCNADKAIRAIHKKMISQ